MTKTLAACSLVLGALALSSTPAVAADNWIGSWKLNVAKSKIDPGPAPQSQTLTFETTADGIKLTTDGVDADGKTTHGGYTAKFDGTSVSFTGNPNADTASPKRIDANTYENTWKKGGKVTMNSKAVVSADGKTLTITQTGTNAKGEAVNSTLVYDRQ